MRPNGRRFKNAQTVSTRKQLDEREFTIRPATGRQIRAIQAIAGRRSLDLTEELRGRFGIERPEDLSLNEGQPI